MGRVCFRLLGIVMAALLLPAAWGQSQISLTVDTTQSPLKILHVSETIPVEPGPLTLNYPKWIPGNHSPSGPISSLTGLKFEANGKMVPWRRDLLDVFTFHLDVPAGASELHAQFDFLEPDGYSATDKLLVLEWNEVALYLDPTKVPAQQQIFAAKLILPEGWKFGTALPVKSQSGNEVTFTPVALNRLVDSPVDEGEYYRAIDITPPGEPIHHEIDLVADSAAALNMSPAVQQELTNLVKQAGLLFGTRHYRDYHFLLALSDHVAHFGLEHHESNDSRLPERTLLEPSAGFVVGSLLPHEYVHSWNGKFRRPADLTTPYYEQAEETDLLWGYEGLTEYLGPMLAARSGLWTPEEYREFLASIAEELGLGRPGRTWRPLLDTAVAEPGLGFGRGGWINWRRGTDYYDEGDLMWLEVATIIHDTTHGQKSIDDFCHLFHGGPNLGPQVKTYTFQQLVDTLNQVAPYDWAAFFHQHLDSTSPQPPVAGIENAGWKPVLNSEPVRLPGRRGGFGDAYSLGLQVGPDGTIFDSIMGSPAYQAGVTSGMKLVGVNGRVYTPDDLEDAIDEAQHSSAPIQLLVVDDDYYRTANVDYHGGQRYPHLVREEGKPDYLDELIAAKQ